MVDVAAIAGLHPSMQQQTRRGIRWGRTKLNGFDQARIVWIPGLLTRFDTGHILSAVQRLPTVPTKQFTGVSNAGIPEIIRKLRIQSAWNAAGAVAAALAAILQGAGSACGH